MSRLVKVALVKEKKQEDNYRGRKKVYLPDNFPVPKIGRVLDIPSYDQGVIRVRVTRTDIKIKRLIKGNRKRTRKLNILVECF